MSYRGSSPRGLTPEAIAERLARIPLLAALAPEHLGQLAGQVRVRRYATDQPVFLGGDPGDEFFLILDGTVRIVSEAPSGREVTLAILGPGNFFGDMALLDGEPRSASAYAVDPCQMLMLRRSDFLEVLKRSPDALYSLVVFLSQRLRRANERIQDLALLSSRERLAAVLRDLAEREGEPDGTSILLPKHVTHRTLAGLLGTSRETITRMVSELRMEGLVDQRGRRLEVTNLAALKSLLEA